VPGILAAIVVLDSAPRSDGRALGTVVLALSPTVWLVGVVAMGVRIGRRPE